VFFSQIVSRRGVLAILSAAGVGLLGMRSTRTAAADTASDRTGIESGGLNSVLPNFKQASRDRLHRLMHETGFSGEIPSAEVRALLDGEQKNIDALMLGLLPLAQTYARPPISKYKVGAVVRGTTGSLYLGANIEIPGQPLNFSVHAEQSALSNAYMHSDSGVSAIAVTAAPCGHCRQFMQELSPAGDIEILIEGKPAEKLSTLLPLAFGPKDLGFPDGAFPVKDVDLRPLTDSPGELTIAALDAARKSYAPYSKAHSGVALGTRAGRIYKGSYIENVAFNPSLSPLQTALAALIVAGENYSSITGAVLIETEGPAISQRGVSEAALNAIAPSAKLRVITIKMKD
jgi:cytidine deaminase